MSRTVTNPCRIGLVSGPTGSTDLDPSPGVRTVKRFLFLAFAALAFATPTRAQQCVGGQCSLPSRPVVAFYRPSVDRYTITKYSTGASGQCATASITTTIVRRGFHPLRTAGRVLFGKGCGH